MNQGRAFCMGALLGAGAMYFLDPRLGRRRRALVEDQLNHWSHETADGLDTAWRDLRNRAYGTKAEMQAMFQSHEAPDDVIAQRVRSRAGRCLSQPGALEVDVSDGAVVLRGAALRHEAEPLIQAVRWVRGVRSVDNQLDLQDEPGDIASLQGEGRRRNRPSAQWAPATRLLATGCGAALLVNCLLRGTSTGLLGGLAGTALVVRALSNQSLRQAIGMLGQGESEGTHREPARQPRQPAERLPALVPSFADVRSDSQPTAPFPQFAP